LEDFPSDQLFNVRIVDGEDYGSILIPGYSDSTTQRWYVQQGFSFYAKKQIPSTSVQASVYVEATQGGASSIKPDKPLLNKGQSTIHKTIIPQSILQKNSSLKSNLVINPNISYKSSATKSVKQVSSVNSTQDDGTLFGTGTITIEKEGIKAYFDKSTFTAGDTLNVIIKRIDSNGNEIDYPDTTNFEVGIKEGCELGNILTSTNQKGGFFSQIRAPIRFLVADSINTGTDTLVVLRVGAPNLSVTDTKVSNSKIAGKIKNNISITSNQDNVKNQKVLKKINSETSCAIGTYSDSNADYPTALLDNIKINLTLQGPKEIWPFLPPTTKKESRGADLPGYHAFTSLNILVTKEAKPLPNTDIKITIERIEGTGGHNHVNPLNIIDCGNLDGHGNPYSIKTDKNGQIVINKLLSSQVSGIYKIKAVLVSNDKISDTTSIIVKVPGLIDFRKIIGNNFWVLPNNPAPGHTSNHWCTEDMSYLLSSAIIDFHAWNVDYSKSLSKVPIILSLNDMSLIWGGAYEYNADWNLQNHHAFHRVG